MSNKYPLKDLLYTCTKSWMGAQQRYLACRSSSDTFISVKKVLHLKAHASENGQNDENSAGMLKIEEKKNSST